MTINLINVAKYDLNEEKTSSIPLSVFRKLTSYNAENTKDNEQLPKARLFKTQADFLNLTSEEMMEFDETKDVRVLSNGQFIVFFNEPKKSVKNGSTNTQEDKQ